MSMFYGSIDYTHVDIDEFQIFYRATPLDNEERAYGSTGDYFKQLASSQDPFVLSQGNWKIEVQLISKNTEIGTTIDKDEIIEYTFLWGEVETYINLNTRSLDIPCSFPTKGKGKLYLAYSTPKYAENVDTKEVTYPEASAENVIIVDETTGSGYVESKGLNVRRIKMDITVSLWKLDGNNGFIPAYEISPTEVVTIDKNGNRTTNKKTALRAKDNGTSLVWQFTDTDKVMEVDTGFYIVAIQDRGSFKSTEIIAKKYYSISSDQGDTIYDETGVVEYTNKPGAVPQSYLESVYGETITVFVAPSVMTTIIKGNSDYSLNTVDITPETNTINHQCDKEDVHYYVHNQDGKDIYCAYCSKGNQQAKDAAITNHTYFYKRSDGVYCVVDIPSIPLSPEEKDNSKKLTYAWSGYEGAKAAAKYDYEHGLYRLCTYNSVHGYTYFMDNNGSYLKDGQFFFFLNFDGTVASFRKDLDTSVENFSKTTSFYEDTAAGVYYPYIYTSRQDNTSYIYVTSNRSISDNSYACINGMGIYEHTTNTKFNYTNNAVKRALEAGQRYCMMYVDRTYTNTTGTGSAKKTVQAMDANNKKAETGRTLVALNYQVSKNSVKNIYEDLYGFASTSETEKAFVWQAAADWEVFSLMDHFNGDVSSNTETNGIVMTSFAKIGGGRGDPSYTYFMGGIENSLIKVADHSYPQLPDNKDNDMRWELFFDYNRDVIMSGRDADHPLYAWKFATLFGSSYFRYYGEESWADKNSLNVNPKDGRYVSVFSSVVTSYVAAAHGKSAYYLFNPENQVMTIVTDVPVVDSEQNGVVTFQNGIVVSKEVSSEDRAKTAATAIGFYINYRGEVVSVGNDESARAWAEDAGCAYYVSMDNYYVTISRADNSIPLDVYKSSNANSKLFNSKDGTVNADTISLDLIVRIAAIRNAGATYFFEASGSFVKTGFRAEIFHGPEKTK